MSERPFDDEPERESIILRNARANPNYKPYCMRCPGLVRMYIIERFYWGCDCGARHDERDNVKPGERG